MMDVVLKPLQSSGNSKRIRLHFGQAYTDTEVEWAGQCSVFHMPESVMQQWSLRPGQKLRVWQSPNQDHIHIGPLFGIIFEQPERKVAKVRAAVIAALAAAADAARMPLLLFSAHDVDVIGGTVTGDLYQGEGHWLRTTVPIPDVVYNRATYPDFAARRRAKSVRRSLRREWSVPFINSVAAFSKWTIHVALARFAVTRRHNPLSIKFDTADRLHSFIRHHRVVFVKANSGTWGQSVLEVSVRGTMQGPFLVQGYNRNERVVRSIPSFARLFAFLERLRDGSRWIVQQAIGLMTLHDRRFDVRLVLQKDGIGQWQVAQRLINWAGRGDVVTNNRLTAEFLPAERFGALWPDGAVSFAKLINKAERVARNAAHALEIHHGLLGEIGFDIGIDRGGDVWVIEANAKPFLAPGVGTEYPFAYARHLARRHWRARHPVM